MPHRFGIRERTTCREFNSLDRVSSNCAAVAWQRERVENWQAAGRVPRIPKHGQVDQARPRRADRLSV